MMRSLGILAAALALCTGAGAGVAWAEETPPPANSSPGDPFGGRTLTPGPIYVITPDAGGTSSSPDTELPPTSSTEEAEALVEDDAAANPSAAPGSSISPGGPGPTLAPTLAPTVGSTPDVGVIGSEEETAGSVAPSIESSSSSSQALWWAGGAGGLALIALAVVLLAPRRLRRLRDRSSLESLNEHAS